MQLQIIAVGHKMPGWINAGFDEYAKRMPIDCRILLREIKPVERSTGKTAESVMAQERTRIEAAIAKGSTLVALDEHGQDFSSARLAQQLTRWQQNGKNVTFVIGGADGLDPELKQKASLLLRLSSLTLPHGLARVLLAEQLYRAWTITQNHPYHRV